MINSALPRSTVETPPSDEPIYDMGPHSSLIPMQDVHCQNFEFSGFITLIEETYEKLRAVDPRLLDRLPFSLFQHVMCNHLNLTIAEVARQNGQHILNFRTDLREALPDYQCLPKSVVDYIAHVTNVITGTGIEIKLNLPDIAIPSGDGELSGPFGAVNAQSHNVYEAYISPYVTAARVIASRNGDADYRPLPIIYTPPNLVPNRNLLGFGPVDIQNPGMRQRLMGFDFPADDTIEGRYKIHPTACTRVYNILAEMKDKFSMVEFRRENNPNGLNSITKIKPKTTAANLTFVESTGPEHPLQTPLHEKGVTIGIFKFSAGICYS